MAKLENKLKQTFYNTFKAPHCFQIFIYLQRVIGLFILFAFLALLTLFTLLTLVTMINSLTLLALFTLLTFLILFTKRAYYISQQVTYFIQNSIISAQRANNNRIKPKNSPVELISQKC